MDRERTREWIEDIQRDAFLIKFVEEQTPELCLVAVRQNAAFEFVRKKTPKISLDAIRNGCYGYITGLK